MSGLYVKVMTGFYSHRKTVRLRASIGDDAFWIPPRLWAYAAENQPDGDMSGYSDRELALLLGCDGHATSIRQALLEAGFLDEDGMIHDWEQHNSYHKTFSERAKAAAEARWGAKKEKNQKKEGDGYRTKDKGDKHCLTHACGMLEACLKHPWVFPAPLDTESFRQSWADWISFRFPKKKMAKPIETFAKQLEWLGSYSEAQAAQILNASIRNDWQGLFEPKNNNATTSGRNSRGHGPNGNPRNDGIAGFDEWERERQARAVGDGQDGPPA